MPARVFVSYAHRDETVATALAEHLAQLERLKIADVWFDRRLDLGDAWETRIFEEIRRSDTILLLVSPAFLSSEFINEKELPQIAETGRTGATVVPVIVAPCLWETHPYIGSLQAFAQGRPLESPTTKTFGRQAAELVEQISRHARAAPRREAPRFASPLVARELDREEEPESEPVAPRRSRVDANGIAYKGSQLQTQIYVNARTRELDAALRNSLATLPAGAELEWRSPLAAERFREYHDRSFLRALGLSELSSELASFWPSGGPRWDALARVRSPDAASPGVVLVEGKSHAAEMESGGPKAVQASRERIAAVLADTQKELGVPPDPGRWMGRFYQFANRLAHLVWLRKMGVDARLVHLLFTDDPHCPTSEGELRRAVEEMHAEHGLAEVDLEHVGVAVLPALVRSELTDAS